MKQLKFDWYRRYAIRGNASQNIFYSTKFINWKNHPARKSCLSLVNSMSKQHKAGHRLLLQAQVLAKDYLSKFHIDDEGLDNLFNYDD